MNLLMTGSGIDLTVLTSILSVLAGSSAVISVFMYRKQTKRFKSAEAFEKEVQALESTVKTLQKQVEWQETRLAELQMLLGNKDAYISQLSTERHVFEVKNSKNKSAINKAYQCEYCKDISKCPVLVQRAVNEETYLKEIQAQ